ncbi:hypothetical protein IGI04_015739 [Brassica rapa subsp. trilocularis]|uniref:Uncharacterized protein n=1 Tax=Brassica rapa subsp. trilocularis TaxID=1813537 RepID=A0ABQ7MQY1_BRACM|nr:hypothetical protein IGI04_015739 [Brassica rapa subsp. trilocularis]
MAVNEQDELPKATQREAELQRQIMICKVKKSSTNTLTTWSRAPRSSASSYRRILPFETRTKPSTRRVTRSVDSGLKFALCRLWRRLTPEQARISQLRRRAETHQRAKRPRMLRPTTWRTATWSPSPIKKHQTEQRERSLL